MLEGEAILVTGYSNMQFSLPQGLLRSCWLFSAFITRSSYFLKIVALLTLDLSCELHSFSMPGMPSEIPFG